MSESFFKDFVHGFGFLMSFSADGAIDEVRMKGAAFLLGKFAVNIRDEPVVDFVVNGCHTFNPMKRERAEVVCAWRQGRGRGSRAGPHC